MSMSEPSSETRSHRPASAPNGRPTPEGKFLEFGFRFGSHASNADIPDWPKLVSRSAAGSGISDSIQLGMNPSPVNRSSHPPVSRVRLATASVYPIRNRANYEGWIASRRTRRERRRSPTNTVASTGADPSWLGRRYESVPSWPSAAAGPCRESRGWMDTGDSPGGGVAGPGIAGSSRIARMKLA